MLKKRERRRDCITDESALALRGAAGPCKYRWDWGSGGDVRRDFDVDPSAAVSRLVRICSSRDSVYRYISDMHGWNLNLFDGDWVFDYWVLHVVLVRLMSVGCQSDANYYW